MRWYVYFCTYKSVLELTTPWNLLLDELDLDNLTIPTTTEGLRAIIPELMPIQLPPTRRKNKNLPSHVPVGVCGFIYALASFKQKVAACEYISSYVPPAPPLSVFLFIASTLTISSVTLLDAFEKASITHVAIACYGMKCRSSMDVLIELPSTTWLHLRC